VSRLVGKWLFRAALDPESVPAARDPRAVQSRGGLRDGLFAGVVLQLLRFVSCPCLAASAIEWC